MTLEGTVDLQQSAARCRAVGQHLQETAIQDLAAEVLTLGRTAATLGGPEAEILSARIRQLQGYARLLGALASELTGTGIDGLAP